MYNSPPSCEPSIHSVRVTGVGDGAGVGSIVGIGVGTTVGLGESAGIGEAVGDWLGEGELVGLFVYNGLNVAVGVMPSFCGLSLIPHEYKNPVKAARPKILKVLRFAES